MLDTPRRKKPNAIDVLVGSRIRLARNMIKMSQEKLGEILGITFQQVQKYEKGTNRVGASRLQAIADAVGMPVSWFFEDQPGADVAGSQANEALDFVSSSEGLSLIRTFTSIKDANARRKLLGVIRAVADLTSN